MDNSRSGWKRVFFLLPFVLGAVGLAVSGEKISNSLFYSLQMYVLNYSDTAPNALVEIARWTAPLASASGILMLLSTLSRKLSAAQRLRKADSVAVYGPEEVKTAVLKELGSRGVDGGNDFLKAKRYLLLGSQTENFAFWTKHSSELVDAQVYIRCDTLPGQSVSAPNLHLFQPVELAARLFWKEAKLYPESCSLGHRMTISMIGCGDLGDSLLYWGLQNNIFDPGQKITYRIFGESGSFPKLYPQLGEITDPVEFMSGSWKDHLPELKSSDRILVLSAEGQEAVVSRLLTLLPGKTLDVLTREAEVIRMLDGQERIRIFDIARETLSAERIMGDGLLSTAKRINMRYAHIYSGAEETPERSEAEWEKLDAFTRYSNISSADYHEIRLQMLEAMGAGPDGSGLTEEQKETLSELEHIRWCRYHWLNNWRHGIPENGKAKDAASRIHIDLIPYQELTEPEKQKDRDTIDVMLGL
ncbi:MAG: hypothetical protein K5637_00735 [Lachnospiraceae bacterium]|nr:hypothetical protein [Lachnospiraceae bacterium]